MKAKKTLYQVLDISANASGSEIRAAHQQQVLKLRSEEGSMSHEDFDFRLKLVNLALDTLCDSLSRRVYDEKLMSRMLSASAPPAVAVQEDAETLARRADALAFRADALALRADALSIRSDGAPFKSSDRPPTLTSRIFSALESPVKRIFIVIGTLAAIAMLVQTAFLFFSVRKVERTAAVESKAEEQIVIQEYYQKYGVRPANATEARLLEQENQRKENEARTDEREKQRAEEKARRFQEEARREGERVTSDLRYAEENLRREAAQKKAEREEEERRREEAEKARVDREREKWHSVLSRD